MRLIVEPQRQAFHKSMKREAEDYRSYRNMVVMRLRMNMNMNVPVLNTMGKALNKELNKKSC